MSMNIKGKGIVSGNDVPTVKAKKSKSTKKRSLFRRAKADDGKFLADDPATPDINEAWVDGESPKSSEE